MLTIHDFIYYLLFSAALTLSFKATKENIRGLEFLRLLLIVGLISEIGVDYVDLVHASRYSNLLYSIYIPFEFTVLCLFLSRSTQNGVLRKLIIYSIPLYFIIVIFYVVLYYSVDKFPGVVYNVGCSFVTLWAVLILFKLEVDERISIVRLPFFWICSGLIILYMGVFFYNAVYNYLNITNPPLASLLRSVVNMNLNYLFYIFWCYAFICSIRLKKYSIP